VRLKDKKNNSCHCNGLFQLKMPPPEVHLCPGKRQRSRPRSNFWRTKGSRDSGNQHDKGKNSPKSVVLPQKPRKDTQQADDHGGMVPPFCGRAA